MLAYPRIIQGGMGIGVSGWRLARAVAELGQLGIVSGTVLDVVLARRLQLGDPDGQIRRALQRFPVPGVADRILNKYYISGGKPASRPFAHPPPFVLRADPALVELTAAANFVEVFLAKEGHSGLVGINYLERVQLPTLPALFGAMLAGVDYVLMGAGIPRAVPGILDRLAANEAVELKIDVSGSNGHDRSDAICRLDPVEFCGGRKLALKRPMFLAIVSSSTLAATLARKSSGQVNGFVIEGPTAGGHNAPPRGPLQLNARGEPIYGSRDVPDLEQMRALGLPFWLAGGFGRTAKLAEALSVGAAGIQVGTAFAFCDEANIQPDLKRRVLEQARNGATDVVADPLASPTGFPFQVLQLNGSASAAEVYARRSRICDIRAMRQVCQLSDGTVGYRCAAEPIEHYLRKDGQAADTHGRKCLCSALMANVGLAQVHANGDVEPPLLTVGQDVGDIARFLKPGCNSYAAADVVHALLAETT